MSDRSSALYNLHENFNRERSELVHKISTLSMQLAVKEHQLNIAAREREISDGEEGEGVCQGDVARTTGSETGSERAEERRSKSLEADCHMVQHQALEAKSQKVQVQVLVQRRPDRAASSPPAVEMETWQSARESVSPIVEHAPQQGRGQGQRKRKRARRGGDRT